MNPENLETIITISKYVGGGAATISTLLGVNILINAFSNYNVAKQTYSKFPIKAQEEVGKPKLKQYFKDATKELFRTYNHKSNKMEPHHIQIQNKFIDVTKERLFREAGLYDKKNNSKK